MIQYTSPDGCFTAAASLPRAIFQDFKITIGNDALDSHKEITAANQSGVKRCSTGKKPRQLNPVSTPGLLDDAEDQPLFDEDDDEQMYGSNDNFVAPAHLPQSAISSHPAGTNRSPMGLLPSSALPTGPSPQQQKAARPNLPVPLFMVSLSALVNAITICAQAAGASCGGTVLMTYPSLDGRLLVEGDSVSSTAGSGGTNVVAQCSLTTQSPSEIARQHYTLRFEDALVPNRFIIRGESLREWVADAHTMGVEQVLLFANSAAFCLHGTNSPFGNLTIEVDKFSDSMIKFEVGDDSLQPKFLANVLPALAASALTSGTGSGFKGEMASIAAAGGGFQKVMLQINTEGQLCVTHMPNEHDVQYSVQFVVQPLSAMLDM